MKTLKLALAALLAVTLYCVADTATNLTPNTMTETFTPGETNKVAGGQQVCGASLLLTNCVAMAGISTVQDLTGISGYVRIGNARTSLVAQITVQNVAAGTFWALGQVPAASALIVTNPTHSNLYYWETDKNTLLDTTVRVELTLTNLAGIAKPYSGAKTFDVRAPLQ